jgi:2Fe-2S ferredoxin
MAGELIARGIVESDDTWRLFAPYELVWAGGKVGRAAVQGVYWGLKPLERIGQGLARYREGARRRKAERVAARKSRAGPAITSSAEPPAPPDEPAQSGG